MALGKTQKQRLFNFLKFLLVLAFVFVAFLPLVSLVLTSLKTRPELYQLPAKLLPKVPQWSNYIEAWTMVDFGKYLVNSLIISVFYTLPCIMGSCFAGYGFARFNVPENKAVFLLMLSTMMIPFMVWVVPFYLIVSKAGLVDKRWMWILWGLQGMPFLIFLFKQYFSTVPMSFEESAKIDGANRFQIFFSIMFPLVNTAVIIAAIWAFNWSWANYLRPVLFLSNEKVTLAVKLARGYTDFKDQLLHNIAMAGILYYSLPVILLFFFLQRRFISGLMSGGLKG
jgi:ABC-type glycerol-3-phosphate transport system permease component